MTRLILAAGLACGFAAVANAGADFNLQKVGDRVWAAISTDTGKSDGNAGFVIGDDGILVVDTFEDPAPAKDLLAEIRKISNLPIRFVVNTHYHIDHVNGNDVFAAAGAVIVAHRNVRAWIRTENMKFFGPNPTAEQKARVESITLPTVVHDGAVDLYLGSRRVTVRFYPGHTGGDSVVSIPDAHVVFCGDLLWKEHIPNFVDANTPAWIKTLDAFSVDYGVNTWVPGHGGPATAEDIATFRKYIVDVRTWVANARAEGKSGDALVKSVLPEVRAKYGKWGYFDELASAGIQETAEELAGTKKVPVPAASVGAMK
jgi:glyoxylase-like metal-dependent hydrolase (beta-lactamase superfamily II)